MIWPGCQLHATALLLNITQAYMLLLLPLSLPFLSFLMMIDIGGLSLAYHDNVTKKNDQSSYPVVIIKLFNNTKLIFYSFASFLDSITIEDSINAKSGEYQN